MRSPDAPPIHLPGLSDEPGKPRAGPLPVPVAARRPVTRRRRRRGERVVPPRERGVIDDADAPVERHEALEAADLVVGEGAEVGGFGRGVVRVVRVMMLLVLYR